MGKTRRDDQCIEHKPFVGDRHFYSVAEYEEGRRAAEAFSGTDVREFIVIAWALGAPPPERLTVDWQPERKPPDLRDQFRICDWDAYDAQMRELLGLV
jgi:hypothetical protein